MKSLEVSPPVVVFLQWHGTVINGTVIQLSWQQSYLLPGHKKKLQCWCWEAPLSSLQELSQEPEPSQSWWHGADWRGGWCQGTSCHGSAPQCKAPGSTRSCKTLEVYTARRVVVTQTPVSHLILLVVLNLVVQAQLDQVQHHAQHMLWHVLMIHPYLEHVKLLVYTEEQVKSSA